MLLKPQYRNCEGILQVWYLQVFIERMPRKRLFASTYKNRESTNKHRKIRRGKAKRKDDKNEEKDGKCYEAGAF